MSAPDGELTERLAHRRAAFSTKAIRAQFGETMLRLAAERPDLVALTADLAHATGMEAFARTWPERLINVGVAEQNMTGIAAGLALCGKLPVVCGYAAFTSLRAVEQAKLDCAYNAVKVILTGQSAGLSYGVGGPTHQTYEDVAIMRAIPNMAVVVPSDAPSVDRLLRAAVAREHAGPVYVRLGRGAEPIHDPDPPPLEIGRARRLREGDDVALLANGAMVVEALLAADELAQRGIAARVLELHTVKPLDLAAIRAAAAETRAMIVVEEHSLIGGLGAAVLEALAPDRTVPVHRIGMEDRFPPIGPTAELRAALGLSAAAIVARALAIVDR